MKQRWGIWDEEEDDFISLNHPSYDAAVKVALQIREHLNDQGNLFTGLYVKQQCPDHYRQLADHCDVCDVYAEES